MIIAKVALLLLSWVVCRAASTQTRSQNADGSYEFGYQVVDATGASHSRLEKGDAAGRVRGSYALRGADGVGRNVEYVADSAGYRAVVHTNEPGTARSAPAGAIIDSPYPAPVGEEPVAAPVSTWTTKFTVVHPAPVVEPVTTTKFVHVAPLVILSPFVNTFKGTPFRSP